MPKRTPKIARVHLSAMEQAAAMEIRKHALSTRLVWRAHARWRELQ
jgi:hypothetical protein